MYELYRKQEKGGCQLQIFPFPPKYWIGFQFCGGGREGGGGEVSMPQVSIDQTREIYTSFIFFFRWLFLISITPVTHTAKSPCSTVYLFHFVPVIHVTFVFNFFFNFIFQCSIQRLSTFKDRFMYIVYIDSAKRICAIIQSGQVFILWIYISLKTVERHVKSSRK